jgi:NADPH:quinone reductase-like Zn-dependent oxidoreductase
MSATIERLVINKPGGFDRIELAREPAARLGSGQLRVRVRAAGVNYADAMVRRGLYKTAHKYVGYPIAPGFEVAGDVVEVGEGASRFAVGDRVIGVTLFGGYTSELCIDEDFVFAMPESWSYEQAAAFPAVYMTAWFALCELAHPRKGSKILVHSAAGGVGTALARLGRILDLEVIGVVGAPHKVEAAKAAGCHHVIDKSSQNLWAEAKRLSPKGYDVVLDANGVATLKQSYEHLGPIGRLVVYGFSTMIDKTKSGRTNWIKLAVDFLRTPRFSAFDLSDKNRSVLAFNLSDLFQRKEILHDAMSQLLGWVEAGAIPPGEPRSYPFAEASEAHRAIESGLTTGKLVLVPT